MYLLILMVFIIALGFIFLKQLDQRRWHRYQIDRDMYFSQHPYVIQSSQQYSIYVAMNKSAQFKLINELMLKSVEPLTYREVLIQRMPAQSHHQYIIKVMIKDIVLGYLEKNYAERFCQSLEATDFFIGRPILVCAEISVCESVTAFIGCKVKLDLPVDPTVASQLVFEKPSNRTGLG